LTKGDEFATREIGEDAGDQRNHFLHIRSDTNEVRWKD